MQVSQEHPYGRAFQGYPALGPLGQAGDKGGHGAAIEIAYGNHLLLCPLRELLRDGQFPLQRCIRISKGVKFFEEESDFAGKQEVERFVVCWGCCHFALLSGMVPLWSGDLIMPRAPSSDANQEGSAGSARGIIRESA